MIDLSTIKASAEFKRLEDKRAPFLDRAKEAAKLTIPQLYPETEETSTTTYPTPYQSLGARGVNNLANKIILSLFPPATAFFKLGMNPLVLKQSGISQGQLEESMLKVEKGIINEMEISQLRAVLVDVIKQGVVGGSSVIYVPPEGKPHAFNMQNFTVRRSKSGEVIKLVLKEEVSFPELSSEIQGQLQELDDKERDGTKPILAYTMVILIDGMYHTFQEIKGQRIAGTDGSYKKKDVPYVFVPFVDRGEDLGRSYVEDTIGDLKSYEGLRQAILEASSEAARLIYLVRPNAVITPKKLEKASSGDVLLGSADDVSVLQADKRLDLQMAQTEAEVLRTDLSTIFLLDSAVRRNAERVTAEEIRKVSEELEIALGGIYSTLANVLQEPLVRLYLKRLVKKGFIKDILKDNIELEITTGSAALGRGTEFRAIQTFIQTAIETVGPEIAAKYLDVKELLNRMAYSLDVNTGSLIKSEEQLQAEANAEHQKNLEIQGAGPAINAANQQAIANNQQGK